MTKNKQTMELKTAIEILEYHQEWGLGKREDMIHEPKKLTEALDVLLNEVKKLRLGAVISQLKKIETYADLPPYGKYVLVSGIDKKQYGIRRWHVCEMNDLEDGVEFKENGNFFWLTEKGTKIEDVTHWCELPTLV